MAKRKSKKGFGGIPSIKSVGDTLKKTGFFLAGFVGSHIGGNMLETKVLKVTPEDEGMKKFIKPVVQIVAGVLGATMLKNENLKLVAYGVTGSGAISGVKVLLKKDLLAGFGDIADANNAIDLKIEPYNPDLPKIDGPEDYERLSRHEEEVQGFLGEYAEIQEVPIS